MASRTHLEVPDPTGATTRLVILGVAVGAGNRVLARGDAATGLRQGDGQVAEALDLKLRSLILCARVSHANTPPD